MLLNEPYCPASDVYSFAIVEAEMLARTLPYADLSLFAVPVAVTTHGRRPELPAGARRLRVRLRRWRRPRRPRPERRARRRTRSRKKVLPMPMLIPMVVMMMMAMAGRQR